MKKKTYYELLLEPRWQQKKTEILQRDKFICQHCGRTDRTLHVHHLLYDKDAKPWEYDNKYLLTLCESCHENDTEESRESYGLFLETKRKIEEFGFSHSIFNDILRGLSFYFDCINEEEDPLPVHDSFLEVLKYFVCNSGGKSDVVSLSKIDKDFALSVLTIMFPNFKLKENGEF